MIFHLSQVLPPAGCRLSPRITSSLVGSLVCVPPRARCWGPDEVQSPYPGRNFTEEMSPWCPGQGWQTQPERRDVGTKVGPDGWEERQARLEPDTEGQGDLAR